MLPWSIKIIYGFLADTVPLYGSKKRSYLYVGAFVQMLAMTVMSAEITMPVEIALSMLFLANFAIAISDVVLDSILVI